MSLRIHRTLEMSSEEDRAANADNNGVALDVNDEQPQGNDACTPDSDERAKKV